MENRLSQIDNFPQQSPDPFRGKLFKTSKYYGKFSPKGKIYTPKQIRSKERFDKLYPDFSEDEDECYDDYKHTSLDQYVTYTTDNVHYNMVQYLMNLCCSTKNLI